jgi:hypothetical protein
MTTTYQLYDFVYLKSDKERELMQIVSCHHYPEQTDATFDVWATDSCCLVQKSFHPCDFEPVPVSHILKHFEEGYFHNEVLPIKEYVEEDVKECIGHDGKTKKEIEEEIGRTLETFPNNFKFNDYEINPDEENVFEFEDVIDGIDTPHYLHQIQQLHRAMWGVELVKYAKAVA